MPLYKIVHTMISEFFIQLS